MCIVFCCYHYVCSFIYIEREEDYKIDEQEKHSGTFEISFAPMQTSFRYKRSERSTHIRSNTHTRAHKVSLRIVRNLQSWMRVVIRFCTAIDILPLTNIYSFLYLRIMCFDNEQHSNCTLYFSIISAANMQRKLKIHKKYNSNNNVIIIKFYYTYLWINVVIMHSSSRVWNMMWVRQLTSAHVFLFITKSTIS